MKGLSRVMGNYHARFLGGLGPAMAPGYPVLTSHWDNGKMFRIGGFHFFNLIF